MADKFTDLDQLKQILLSDNIHSISQLENKLNAFQSQWENENWLIKTLDPAIFNLFSQKINESPEKVADSFAPVIGVALKKQIETAREDIIDVLHPVIGQTIRKSITEAMKNLVQSVNRQVEHALSFKMVKAKVKSKFTGVDNAELLLKQAAQQYHVSQIFYIHKETGLLITHASDKNSIQNDEDIISGMLSAIRDFAKTAFSEKEDQELSEIQYGDFQILIENGRNAYIAVVVTGIFPLKLKEKISILENDLHKKYFQNLRHFDGNVTPFKEVQKSLTSFINHNNLDKTDHVENSAKPSLKGLKAVIFLIIIAFAIYFSFFVVPAWIEESRINDQLQVLFESNSLLMTEDIQFTVDGSSVLLSGSAASWQNRNEIEKIISDQPEIAHVHNEINVVYSDFDTQNLFQKLETLFPSVMSKDENDIHLVIDDTRLFIEGSVSSEKNKILIAAAIAKITGFPAVINNLEVKDKTVSIKNEIERSYLYFKFGKYDLQGENLIMVNKIAGMLESISFDTLIITGHTDTIGAEAINIKLALKRAENIRNHLAEFSFPDQKLITLVERTTNAKNEKVNKLKNPRRVSFSVK